MREREPDFVPRFTVLYGFVLNGLTCALGYLGEKSTMQGQVNGPTRQRDVLSSSERGGKTWTSFKSVAIVIDFQTTCSFKSVAID